MTGFLSPNHIVLVLIVLLLLFGAKRLPELGRSLGSSMREFRHAISKEAPDGPLLLRPVPALQSATAATQPDASETPSDRPAA